MQTVAAGWLIFDLTRSAAAVGVLGALASGPAIFLSTYGGTLADRFDRRRLTIALYTVQSAPAALLAFLTWATPTAFEVYALTLVLGTIGALASPALQQIVPATVPPDLARRATAIGSGSYSVARLVGPAAAGGLLTVAGQGPCFALNAASFGAVALAAARLPRTAGRSPGAAASLRSAAERVRGQPLLRRIFATAVIFSVLVAPVQELAPAIARDYGEGGHLLGLLISGLAVGGLIAIPTRSLLERRRIRTADALGGSMVVAGGSLLLLAAAPDYAVAVLAMVLCGIGWDVLYILGLNGVQFADRRMSGLMTGLFLSATLGGVTVGALLIGGVFDLVGVAWGLSVCALAAIGAGLWTLGSSRRPGGGYRPSRSTDRETDLLGPRRVSTVDAMPLPRSLSPRRIGFFAMLAGAACATLLAILAAGQIVAPASANSLARARNCIATPAECGVEPVVRRFVAAAVERRNPEASFALVTPELRQGMTRAQWATGNIPVVPFFDVDWTAVSLRFSDATDGVRYYVLRLRSKQLAAAEFWIGLRRRGNRWLVSYFAPAARYGAPSSPS
jgi:predicted MFS family arabinose efflux permease